MNSETRRNVSNSFIYVLNLVGNTPYRFSYSKNHFISAIAMKFAIWKSHDLDWSLELLK